MRLADFRGCGLRCARIALVVGTILTIINQTDRIADPTPALVLRVAANYLTPFIVSSLGWASAQRRLRAAAERHPTA